MIECDTSGILKIILFIKQFIDIIKIAVPIMIIILCMIDIVKIITSNLENVDATKKKIVNRFLAAVLVFLVPTFLNLTLEFFGYTKMEQFSCWIDATEENIKKLEEKEASEKELNSDVNLVDAQKKIEESLKKRKELEEKYKNENSTGVNIGNFPYYNQTVSPWKSVPFCTSSVNVGGNGCGAVSLSMLISGLTGSDSNPRVVANWFCSNGHRGGALPDAFITKTSFQHRFNINTSVMWARGRASSLSTMNNKILSVVNQGNGVLLLIPGHFVALVKGTGDKVQLLDPGNKSNNGLYTVEQLYRKFSNYKNRCITVGKCGFVAAWSVAPR